MKCLELHGVDIYSEASPIDTASWRLFLLDDTIAETNKRKEMEIVSSNWSWLDNGFCKGINMRDKAVGNESQYLKE